MLDPVEIELGKLKARRKQLFELFVKRPKDVHISLEIKDLDDEIAVLTTCREPKKATKRRG